MKPAFFLNFASGKDNGRTKAKSFIMEKTLIKIEGMSCGHCERSVWNILNEIKGVTNAEVLLNQSKAEITYDPEIISKEDIVKKFNENGIYIAS